MLELSTLFQKVLADPDLKAALVTLVGQLCQDAEVLTAVTDLVVKLGADGRVTEVSYAPWVPLLSYCIDCAVLFLRADFTAISASAGGSVTHCSTK